jgi:hypothetical protein
VNIYRTLHVAIKPSGTVLVVIAWWLDLQLPMQSEHITTKAMSSNPAESIHHYVITFVSDLRQVGGLLRVLGFPPPIKDIRLSRDRRVSCAGTDCVYYIYCFVHVYIFILCR